jgi:hypothetical protein
MNMRAIALQGLLLAALISVAGCGHVQTLSTPNAVTVQQFGCNGDIPSPYPPYCRPERF